MYNVILVKFGKSENASISIINAFTNIVKFVSPQNENDSLPRYDMLPKVVKFVKLVHE